MAFSNCHAAVSCCERADEDPAGSLAIDQPERDLALLSVNVTTTMATNPQVSGHQHTAAFDNGHLPVGELHEVYYEQDGKPGKLDSRTHSKIASDADLAVVIFLHGGPGGGTIPDDASFFDPAIYRVVLLDQRGCGKSRPFMETRENTSHLLASDIDTLRTHLGISKWHLVFGGSWGSTLALLYVQTYPEAVGSMVLRGVFTGRKMEFDYPFTPYGAAMLCPEAYERLIGCFPAEDRGNLPAGYMKLFRSTDEKVRREAARIWCLWEPTISRVDPAASDPDELEEGDMDNLAHGMVECHYFMNGLFLEEGELLRKENNDKIRHIPCESLQPYHG